MTDLTLGQRISEGRKRLELSQEALGEKMGISRQAISKWESDAAVPEIDKLIALSRLFGVSVGWLLGVEETAPEAPESLSEQQLELMEQLIKKYQPKPEPTKFRLLLIFGVAVVGLISIMVMTLAGMGVFDKPKANANAIESLQNEMNSQLAQLHSRIDDLTRAQHRTPAPVLLASYDLDISGLLSGDVPGAEISFSGVPAAWQEGDAAVLSIRRTGMETILQPCQWDGAFLTATAFLEAADGYELCLTLNHSDGTQEQQVLSHSAIENLKQSLNITVETAAGTWAYDGDTLSLNQYEFKVTMPMNGRFYADMTWELIDLILLTGKGEELGRFNLLDAGNEEDMDILASSELWTMRQQIRFVGLELPKEEGILLYLSVKTSNGLTAMEPVCAWATDSAGNLRKQ